MVTHISDWIADHDDTDNPLIPAATVVVIRDGSAGIETLMMRRNSKLSFAEGMWVFPGGRIDDADGDGEIDAPTAAAVREAKEEADLDIDPTSLVYYSHWIPPRQAPKRFSTWFYLARATDGAVTIDDGEIVEHAWWSPIEALERAHDRRIEILPPTWMTLHDLSDFASVEQALTATAQRGPLRFATRLLHTADGPAATWEEDAGYVDGDPDAQGARHRLVMTEGPWRLERR